MVLITCWHFYFHLHCVNPKSRTHFFPFLVLYHTRMYTKETGEKHSWDRWSDQRDTTECHAKHVNCGESLKGWLIWVQEGESGIGQLVVSTCIVHHLFFPHSSSFFLFLFFLFFFFFSYSYSPLLLYFTLFSLIKLFLFNKQILLQLSSPFHQGGGWQRGGWVSGSVVFHLHLGWQPWHSVTQDPIFNFCLFVCLFVLRNVGRDWSFEMCSHLPTQKHTVNALGRKKKHFRGSEPM